MNKEYNRAYYLKHKEKMREMQKTLLRTKSRNDTGKEKAPVLFRYL